ncbi:putative plant self-incompatibility S1 [Helianthus annuus]|nr:putative plant self-incompatibility S1 [Helianthus annuus]KAJ0764451.1 putative plant self-incompatibility S1 [Helianthus annuus]
MSFTSRLLCVIVVFNVLVLTWGDPNISKADSHKFLYIMDPFVVHITNAEIDNLMVHCKSNDDDLGDKNLIFEESFEFHFRQNFLFTTEFFCTFRSVTPYADRVIKSTTVIVFDAYISARLCGDGDPRNCYWSVRDDGFYVSKDNKTFPDGWIQRGRW